MKDKNYFTVKDFSGGMNDKGANTLLLPNEGSNAFNVVFDEKGIFKKRPGLLRSDPSIYDHVPKTDANGIHTHIINYFHYKTSESTDFNGRQGNIFVVQKSDGAVYVYDDRLLPDVSRGDEAYFRKVIFFAQDPDIPPDVTYERPPTNVFQKFQIFQYNEKIYLVNSYNGGWVLEPWWEPSDLTQWNYEAYYKSEIPKCDLVYIHNNRAFYTQDPKHPDYVYYSNLAKPSQVDIAINDVVYGGVSTSGAGGILRVPTSQDIAVTGLIAFQGALVIFKEDSIFTLTGKIPDEDWEIKRISATTGCISPRTIAIGNNIVYYLGGDGLYVLFTPFQEQIQTRPISERVEEAIQPFIENKTRVHGSYYKGKYYLFNPNYMGMTDDPSTTDKPRPVRGLVYDEVLNNWTTNDIDAKLTFIDKINDRLLMVIGSTFYQFQRGQLYDDYITGAEPVYAIYETQYYDLGEPHITKRFRLMKIYFAPNLIPNSQVEIKISIDYKESFRFLSTYNASFVWGESRWGEAAWGGLPDQRDRLVRFSGSGGFIRFTFKNNVQMEDLEIHGFTIEYKKRKRIR
jgi:hypothetical protein